MLASLRTSGQIEEEIVFGPRHFQVLGGNGAIHVEEFDASLGGSTLSTMAIDKGAADGSGRVEAATVRFIGRRLSVGDDLQGEGHLTRLRVELQAMGRPVHAGRSEWAG